MAQTANLMICGFKSHMRYMGTKRHIVENNIDLIREYEKLRKPLMVIVLMLEKEKF